VRRDRKAGFTLLEIAVALAILGIGVVTCLQLFSGSLRLQDRASRQSRAVLHARATMDALLFQPEIANHEEKRGPSAEGFVTRILVRDAGSEDGIDERTLGFESDVKLRFLEVDVSWQEGSGSKSYVLRSLRATPDLE